MKSIETLRQQTSGKARNAQVPAQCPELYQFLGETVIEQAMTMAERVIPGDIEAAQAARTTRREIFEYIAHYFHRSTLKLDYLAPIGKGLNLAHRPFLTPSGPAGGEEFTFAEQYRWDTYFQNRALILIGAYDIARDQLLNLVDAFDTFGRIPNALTTDFLSHPQPPLEAMAVYDLLQASYTVDEWSHAMMRVVGQDLVQEWWDYRTGKKNPRQSADFVATYGHHLTRYTSIHFHPLLASCQDGKDHNWINAYYGENYLPVQLNAILYANLGYLADYQQNHLGNSELAATYRELQAALRADFQHYFWVDAGKWRGFRNYSIEKDATGKILYGDLAAEIFPLFVGIATPEQAEVTRQNLWDYYRGDYGLAATSEELRAGGSLETAPPGWEFQWELNCWSPLMLIAVEGLLRYSESNDDLFFRDATTYQENWLRWAENEFWNAPPTERGFHEKGPYDSHVQVEPGFYGVLQGFGWTIATYLTFLHRLAQQGQLNI